MQRPGRGFNHLRAYYGYAEDVGTELHECLVGDHAAVDLQFGEGNARVGVDGVEYLAGLERSCLEGSTGNVALVGEAREAHNGATGVGPPVRSEQAGERRDDVDASVVLHCGGEFFHWGAELIMPRLSRSHWISEPVTAMEPSSA